MSCDIAPINGWWPMGNEQPYVFPRGYYENKAVLMFAIEHGYTGRTTTDVISRIDHLEATCPDDVETYVRLMTPRVVEKWLLVP